ncbi:MAG: translation initiation factor [Cyanobacteriota bacterium]|jgi:translation initiation factor 1
MSVPPRIVYQEFGAVPEPEPQIPATPPHQQTLRLQTSRAGRKGKTVTLITGFQAPPETLAGLLKQLKSHCGTGGAVKEQTLELQGDHREKAKAFLLGLGYRATDIR